MTIDEAIKYADMMALDALPLDDMPEICTFGEFCAAALRLAKKMSENAGISATPVQDTR